MTGSDDFLSRWSRLKREAANETPPADKAEAGHQDQPAPAAADRSSVPASDGPAEPAFDLASLPSLESITAATDVRVFMQPGVPAALTQAALRRAWSTDPAIREFIGLAENAWDFTAPDSMPGFGPLDPAEIPRLLASVFEAPRREPAEQIVAMHPGETEGRPAAEDSIDKPLHPDSSQTSDISESDAVAALPQQPDASSDDESNNDAPQQKETGENATPIRPRTGGHGRALPR